MRKYLGGAVLGLSLLTVSSVVGARDLDFCAGEESSYVCTAMAYDLEDVLGGVPVGDTNGDGCGDYVMFFDTPSGIYHNRFPGWSCKSYYKEKAKQAFRDKGL